MVRRYIACILILFASACLALTGVFERWNFTFYDAALKFKNSFLENVSSQKDKQLVQVDISESAINSLPQGINAWENLAQTLSLLNEQDLPILFPSFFAENAPASSMRKILGQMQMNSFVVLPAVPVPNKILPYLSEEISLSQKKTIEKHLLYPRVLNGQKIAKAERLLLPSDEFARFASAIAFVCSPQDADCDGVLRRMNVFYAYSDGYIPSFAFAVAAKILGIKMETVVLDCGSNLTFTCADGRDYSIPVDSEGRILIPYTGTEVFPSLNFEFFSQSYSDADVSYQISSILKGKSVVLTDSTFEKSRGSQNFFSSPLGTTIPENKAELSLINAFLDNSFFSIYPLWAKYAILFFTVGLVFFAFLFGKRLTFFLTCFILGILIVATELFLFVYMNIAPWIVGPLSVVFAGLIFGIFSIKTRRRSL